MKLLTEAELAADLRITPEKAAELRLAQKWPHVRMTRFAVCYTPAQAEQIIAMHTVEPKRAAAEVGKVAGQTSRSAARAS